MSTLLTKIALSVTGLGLIVGMLAMHSRIMQPLDIGPVVYQSRFSVQRSDLLVVMPTSLKRSGCPAFIMLVIVRLAPITWSHACSRSYCREHQSWRQTCHYVRVTSDMHMPNSDHASDSVMQCPPSHKCYKCLQSVMGACTY